MSESDPTGLRGTPGSEPFAPSSPYFAAPHAGVPAFPEAATSAPSAPEPPQEAHRPSPPLPIGVASPPRRTSTLGIVAIGFAGGAVAVSMVDLMLGLVIGLGLLPPQTLGDGTLTSAATFLLALAAVVLGIVAIAQRRGRGWAIAALAVGAVFTAYALVEFVAPALLFAPVSAVAGGASGSGAVPTPSPSASASGKDFYAVGLTGQGASPDTPFPFGTSLTLRSTDTRQDALGLTVGRPVDVTAVAQAASLPAPANGTYIAVPIESREIDPNALTDASGDVWYPPTQWSGPGGGNYDSVTIEIPGYPSLDTAEPTTDANGISIYKYYEIYDVPTTAVKDGRYEVGLTPPDGTDQIAYWG